MKRLLSVALTVLVCASCAHKPLSYYEGKNLWLQTSVCGNARVINPSSDPIALTAVAELQRLTLDTLFEMKPCADAPHADAFRLSFADGRTTISAASPQGWLYAAFYLLRCQTIGEDISTEWQQPSFDLRILNHWDNLDGTVERGYAGRSIWKWDELPAVVSPRYQEYARANASVGINAVVLNNVNASPKMLSAEYLQKVKVIADVLRPFGQRVYLSVNFASPMALGDTKDADPLNADVAEWWKKKADEIYQLIPDFGGFLVKANSEGQPGPLDYHRSHAEGANMLAAALQPHGGLVMWRAFVYSPTDADRAKQAYLEFQPHDGEFADNVIIQIKNGPVDFQPREPFSPLFGAMPKTRVMAEMQITQEYTGHSNHMCFLPSMWLETLHAETFAYGEGSSILDITTGKFNQKQPSAIAGVANVGDTDNWCGSTMAQANWYAFGRMAWNASLSTETLAREWIAQTMGHLPQANADAIAQMMTESREAVVDYMMPLGLHHIFAWGHHYGPEPWCEIPNAREDWLPRYYHRADSLGLGFDRSPSGSNGCAQYAEPLAQQLASKDSCPAKYLLWFHHVAWTDTLAQTGSTLWDELCLRYKTGLETAQSFATTWQNQKDVVTPALWNEVAQKLDIQQRDARWWHDACLLYFQTFSGLPIPQGTELSLSEMQKFHINIDNYTCAPKGFY